MLAKLPEPNRILLEAAAYIREHGHTKAEMGTHGGARCALGAIRSATRMHKNWDPMDRFRWRVAAEEAMIANLGCEVQDWNDAPERTAQEVISTLETVALTAVSVVSHV